MPAQMPRIASIDALRGVAVLGMLVVNVQSFSSVAATRTNPAATGDLGGPWWVWLATYVLADGKFMAVFSILFGSSICLLASRAGHAATRVHYRRMAILFALGLLHAYGLWYGEILVPLAVCGALAFLYRDLSPVRLSVFGGVVFCVGGVMSGVLAWSRLSQPEGLAAALEYWSPSAQSIAWEISRYRGSWWEQMEHRVPYAFAAQTSRFATRELWRLTGLMLVGMALFKTGVLSGERSVRCYRSMALAGLIVGVPVVLYGALHSFERGWDLRDFRLVGDQLNYWAGALVGLGWIGAVMLVYRHGWRLTPLAAVGRLALTNYLMQTLICTTIFYGHGFGLFARVDRLTQFAIVVGIWALQLALSVWWLKRFAIGPLEWLWRCLTYGRVLPLRYASY